MLFHASQEQAKNETQQQQTPTIKTGNLVLGTEQIQSKRMNLASIQLLPKAISSKCVALLWITHQHKQSQAIHHRHPQFLSAFCADTTSCHPPFLNASGAGNLLGFSWSQSIAARMAGQYITLCVCVCACVSVCMCACAHSCMHVYVCVFVCIHMCAGKE